MHFAQTSASRPVRNLGYIDAIRGLGVLGVLLVHTGQQAGISGRAAILLGGVGDFGVQLFYVASAFTLFLSLDGRKTEASPTRNFFLRRFFRIAPIFYLAILVKLTLAALHIRVTSTEPSHFDIVLGFLFLHGFSPSGLNTVTPGAWSVADECLFYAMLPWLYLRVRNLVASVLALFAGMLINHVANVYFARWFPSQSLYFAYWFPTELPVFMIGVLGYYLWKTFLRGGSHRPRFAPLLSLALLVAAAGILTLVHQGLHGVAAIGVLLGLMLHPWELVVNRATRFLGKISYSMYLLHFFVIVGIGTALSGLRADGHFFWNDRLFGTLLGLLVYFVVLLCLSVPLCTASWLFLEEPFIALGRRLISRLDHQPIQTDSSLVPDPHELVSASNTRDNQF